MRIVLLALASAAFAQAVNGATLCVDPATAGCHPTIASALASASDGDAIAIGAGVFHEGNLWLEHSVAIIGSGPEATTVEGNASAPVFLVGHASAANTARVSVTFWNLGIAHGLRGIEVTPTHAALLDHVRIVENGPGLGAGVLADRASLVVNQSLFYGNVATASHPCQVTVIGGGIAGCPGSDVRVFNTSFVANRSSGDGGGISAVATSLLVHNSTFVGNAAPLGSGLQAYDSPAIVTNTTFGDNPGGGRNVDFQGGRVATLYMLGNIVSTTIGGACYFGVPSYASDENVYGDASCTYGFQLGARDVVADPKLSTYLSWPTGVVQTIQPTSPAIARVSSGDCWSKVDQAGRPRPANGPCDAGSYQH